MTTHTAAAPLYSPAWQDFFDSAGGSAYISRSTRRTFARDGLPDDVMPDPLTTPLRPDYVGVLRHDCPKCGAECAVRRLERELYCEYAECGWTLDLDTPR